MCWRERVCVNIWEKLCKRNWKRRERRRKGDEKLFPLEMDKKIRRRKQRRMRLFTVSVVYVHRAKGGGGGEGLVDDMYFTQVYVQRVGAQERKRDRQRETDC